MHVVQLVPELNQGGVERGVVEFSRELVKLGHRSTVLSAGGRLVTQLNAEGGEHYPAPVCSKNPLTAPWRVQTLRRLFRSLDPDILHARSRVPAWLTYWANKPLGIPWVTTVHGFNSISAYSRIMTRGDRVICVSHPVREHILQHYDVSEDRISVVHRGVDPRVFDPAAIDREWIDAWLEEHGIRNRPILSMVGRISERKGCGTLIRAMNRLRDAHPQLRALIVGDAHPSNHACLRTLQARVRELGLVERVIFTGGIDRVPEVYALSRAVLSCSLKPESFGRSLTEALAMNTPVIAPRHGGALDIVRDGVQGYLFEPDDDEQLAAAIVRVLEREWTGLRDHVLRNFTLDRMTAQVLEVYDSLTATTR
ncbi:glycosyltransferase family 4 protein [Kiritimatiella glycovorans]|uniref:D-inositol 3-phosphate glycosyltransferase n=1 Tax=Kiritimatiella glycovorans TaxID=1307763 RepID=A0A0G3EJY7_9BACT|nr:glycosyltransferase family 4 protein [Kiritimatiella glycovorans]AKJ64444.1 D-inositol 3-phosphate glycosyltransferase [Kiritimatiella glycovorans]